MGNPAPPPSSDLRTIPLTDLDIARIFQALCQEERRLAALRDGWNDPGVIAHATNLKNRFAAIHPNNEHRTL